MDNRKKKKLILRLVILFIVLVLLGAFAFVLYKVYTNPESGSYGKDPEIIDFDSSSAPKEYLMESDALKFELDPETTYFTLTDKANNTVWYSNPENWSSDAIAKSSNLDFLGSTLTVTYSTFGPDIELNNYKYSIANRNYRVSQLEDGSVQVEYTIGEIERVYKIPLATTEERLKQFTDKMGKKNGAVAKKMYTKKDPAKMSADEIAEMAAQYPTIENQVLYVLKEDDTKNKEKLEMYFRDAGYTDEDYDIDNQNLSEIGTSVKGPVFNISVIYSLDQETGDFLVTVPFDLIRCDTSSPLVAVSVLPMFGAADVKTEGFMLVPEGGGAIIRYNNHKTKQPTYVTNVYGLDYAQMFNEAKTENRTALPVFGMARDGQDGQDGNSFICVIESGDAFASITADISEKISTYNEVYAKYKVIHYDKYDIGGKANEPTYMYEAEIPEETIVQRYRFVKGSDYVSMAKSCREYLKNEYKDVLVDNGNPDVPVNFELVGAINKIEIKAGFPIDSVVATTTFDEAEQVMDDLLNAGIKNLNVRMTGWSNGGVRQSVLTSVRTVSKLGGDKGMDKLIAAAKEKGVNLYFDGITCFAYDSNVFDGFLPYAHAARYTTREQVKLYPFDIITFRQADWMDAFYLVKPGYAKECASNLIEDLGEHKAAGIAFRDIGRLLSGDYYYKNIVTRENAKRMNIETLHEAADAGMKIAIKTGNLYAVPYADIINDMDLAGNGYAILDESVPFYQIVIHGLKDYTGQSVNMAGDFESELLKCAEFGAGLNFTFMKKDTMVLQDSPYSCYTSAGYDRWKTALLGDGDDEGIIVRYQRTMSGLNQKEIIGHQRLSENVTVTLYDDGTTGTCTAVFVNAGSFDFKLSSAVNGVDTIPARDYVRFDNYTKPQDMTEDMTEEPEESETDITADIETLSAPEGGSNE